MVKIYSHWLHPSQAVFERLMLPSPGDHVIPTLGNLPDPAAASAAGESTLLYYLAQAYARAQHELQNAIVSVVSKSHVPLAFP